GAIRLDDGSRSPRARNEHADPAAPVGGSTPHPRSPARARGTSARLGGATAPLRTRNHRNRGRHPHPPRRPLPHPPPRPSRELVPACRARTVHATSAAHWYESAHRALAARPAGRTRRSPPDPPGAPDARRPHPAPRPSRELVPASRTRTVHATSSAPSYES